MTAARFRTRKGAEFFLLFFYEFLFNCRTSGDILNVSGVRNETTNELEMRKMSKYKTIGQHENTSTAMHAVIRLLVGNPEARKKFREAYGSVYDAKSKKWIDTNIVHDTLEVYEKATNELNEWGYIS